MGQLEDMALFVRIVEAGGIGKASEQLNLAKSAVSRRLGELEYRLKAPLLHRTTRKWGLTDAGEAYYLSSKNILNEVDNLNAQITGGITKVEGKLKISCPMSFGMLHLSGIVDAFCRLHPELKIQLDLTDRQVDLVEEGYELAIRISNLKDSSLRAKQINTVHHALVASPSYADKHGLPSTPEELTEHAFLRYNLSSLSRIHCYAADGTETSVLTNNKIESNNADNLKLMTIQGHGISYLPTFLVYDELVNGQLINVLPDYSLPTLHIYAVYPNNRFLSQRARAFIDFFAEHCSDKPYWDSFNAK